VGAHDMIGLDARARVPTVPTVLDKDRTGIDAADVACLLVGVRRSIISSKETCSVAYVGPLLGVSIADPKLRGLYSVPRRRAPAYHVLTGVNEASGANHHR
jgi:hypothetical protein